MDHQGSPYLASFTILYPQLQRRQWQPTPVLLPGKSHGWRSLVGCSPWGLEELDTTERLHFHFSLSCIGEGNCNPLQCSCLENPRDGGAWWAAVYGVAQSWTRLKRLIKQASKSSAQFRCSVVSDLCNPMDCSTPVSSPHPLSVESTFFPPCLTLTLRYRIPYDVLVSRMGACDPAQPSLDMAKARESGFLSGRYL